jgi:hypothetical protein
MLWIGVKAMTGNLILHPISFILSAVSITVVLLPLSPDTLCVCLLSIVVISSPVVPVDVHFCMESDCAVPSTK